MFPSKQGISLVLVPTGASENVGQALLEACGGNLEMAIGMHMDDGGDLPGQAAAVPVQEDGWDKFQTLKRLLLQYISEIFKC